MVTSDDDDNNNKINKNHNNIDNNNKEERRHHGKQINASTPLQVSSAIILDPVASFGGHDHSKLSCREERRRRQQQRDANDDASGFLEDTLAEDDYSGQ
jgi:ATP-dependent DNA ligase